MPRALMTNSTGPTLPLGGWRLGLAAIIASLCLLLSPPSSLAQPFETAGMPDADAGPV